MLPLPLTIEIFISFRDCSSKMSFFSDHSSLKSGYEQNYNVKDPRYLRWRALRPQISSQRWIFVISEPKGAMIKVICIVLPLISSPLFNVSPHSARVRIP